MSSEAVKAVLAAALVVTARAFGLLPVRQLSEAAQIVQGPQHDAAPVGLGLDHDVPLSHLQGDPMSITTLMNQLPKHLREELKKNHLYDACFTTADQRTVSPSHQMLVPQGLHQMVERRQELVLVGYTTNQTLEAQVQLLREIEVLRYVAGMMDKERK